MGVHDPEPNQTSYYPAFVVLAHETKAVIPGLVPGIQGLQTLAEYVALDCRNKSGNDAFVWCGQQRL